VEELDLREVKVNERGTGSEQYPPRLLLSLLIYSYATGVFGSRRIERSTYESVAVRVLCADTHPDHDTICTFRRENKELVSEAFVKVLEMAQRLKLLKVGPITVAVDGTKVLANASKHSAVSYQRAAELIEQLEREGAQLLSKAEQADSTPLEEGLTIPDETPSHPLFGGEGGRGAGGQRFLQPSGGWASGTKRKGPSHRNDGVCGVGKNLSSPRRGRFGEEGAAARGAGGKLRAAGAPTADEDQGRESQV